MATITFRNTYTPSRTALVPRADNPDLLVPAEFIAYLDIEGRILAELTIRVTSDGHPELHRLIFGCQGGPPISRSILRDFPIAEVVSRAVANASHQIEDQTVVCASNAPTFKLKRKRRTNITDDHLQEVARVWQSTTLGHGTAHVREHFHTSERTASRWVSAARAKGLIPTLKDLDHD